MRPGSNTPHKDTVALVPEEGEEGTSQGSYLSAAKYERTNVCIRRHWKGCWSPRQQCTLDGTGRNRNVLQAWSLRPASAMAPDDSTVEERHVMAARRQLSTQPRSTSGTKKAPQKQTVGEKITDPLWQYAALAVYPERLRTRRAAA